MGALGVVVDDPGRQGGESLPVCIGPPLGVALRIARETYETAALPLSYVGAEGSIAQGRARPDEACLLESRSDTITVRGPGGQRAGRQEGHPWR